MKNTAPAPLHPRVLNPKLLGQYLGISTSAARQILTSNQIPIIKLPAARVGRRSSTMRRLLVRVEDVDKWLSEHVGTYQPGEWSTRKAG